jgi:LacI family transcriptional regulator
MRSFHWRSPRIEYLMQHSMQKKPNPEKPGRLSDVIALSGVSAATVSRVLREKPGISGETRKRVMEAVDQCGYKPNRRIQKFFKRVNSERFSVLFLVPRHYANPSDDEAHFFHRMLWPLEHALAQHRCAMILACIETALLADGSPYAVAEGLADGVIAICSDTAIVAGLSRHAPVVLFNSEERIANVDVVMPDVERAAFRQMEHLRSLGHERIACYRPRPAAEGPFFNWQDYRFWLAFEKYGQMRGLHQPREWFEPITPSPDTNQESADAFVGRVFRNGPAPTAILTTDVYAAFLATALAKLNLQVPRDVSIMGYDDDPRGNRPPVQLTTYRQDFDGMAKAAVDMLLERMRGKRTSSSVVQLDGEIVHRESVAPAPRTSAAQEVRHSAERADASTSNRSGKAAKMPGTNDPVVA